MEASKSLAQWTRNRRFGGLLAGLIALVPSFATTAAQAEPGEPMAVPGSSFVLDLANRTASVPLGSELADPSAAKLVEIDVAEVSNPRRIGLSFEVRTMHQEGKPCFLGSFALFPPDRPGRFLVATRGSLRLGDVLEVSMVVLDEPSSDDRVRVGVKRISLRDD